MPTHKRTNDVPTLTHDPLGVIPTPLPTPDPITIVGRLEAVYRSPGPYTSVYLATLPPLESHQDDLQSRWSELRRTLEDQGAPLLALSTIGARLTQPTPEDAAGIGLIAAADGTIVVHHGMEPPRHDVGVVDSLPYAAPLLEWDQRRIAHLVVTVDGDGGDIAVFGSDSLTRVDTHQVVPPALVQPVAATAAATGAELIVLSGELELVAPLADRLALVLPANTRITVESLCSDADELAAATVRHVSDLAVREIVHELRDHRFLKTHGGAVDGVPAVIEALRTGRASRLLIHDDPNDRRRVWIGPEASNISDQQRGQNKHARLVDALLRAAVLQHLPITIIPSTEDTTGPRDDVAAVLSLSDLPVQATSGAAVAGVAATAPTPSVVSSVEWSRDGWPQWPTVAEPPARTSDDDLIAV